MQKVNILKHNNDDMNNKRISNSFLDFIKVKVIPQEINEDCDLLLLKD